MSTTSRSSSPTTGSLPVGGAAARRLRFADALPDSEFHVVADAGHYSWEDDPEPYLDHVVRCIDRAEANNQ